MTHKTEKVKQFHKHFHNWFLYISNMSTHGSIWNDKAFGTERTPFLLKNLYCESNSVSTWRYGRLTSPLNVLNIYKYSPYSISAS